MDEEYLFYHYSDKPLKSIACLRNQINLKIKPFTDDEIKKIDSYDEYDTGVKGGIGYSKHISLHIDPLPLDLIVSNFPKESPYFRNGVYLYEHVIDLRDQPCLLWYVAESPLDNFFVNYLHSEIMWDKSDSYRRAWYYVKNAMNRWSGLKGNTPKQCIEACKRFKGTIRMSFIAWMNSKQFSDQGKRMYAASVPHLFYYPTNGELNIHSVNKLKLR